MNIDELCAITGVPIPAIVANTYFSSAACEVYSSFIHENFICCIMASQAVAEGINKYVLIRNNIKTNIPRPQLFYYMMDYGLVCPDYAMAATSLYKSHRNDYHHMNSPVGSIDHRLLATDNIRWLATIENAVFGADYAKGGSIVPRNPTYWDMDGRMIDAYIRLEI